MSVYRINKTRLAELVDRTIKYITPKDLEYANIGNHAFRNCIDLKSVEIKNKTSIGEYAFGGCSSLTSITIDSNTPPVLASTAFYNSGITNTTGTIWVPFSFDHSILNAYKTATNWSNYADIISEVSPAQET